MSPAAPLPDGKRQNFERGASEDECGDVDVGVEHDAEHSASGSMLPDEPFDVSGLDSKLLCPPRAILL